MYWFLKKEFYQARIFDRVEVFSLITKPRKCCGGLLLICHSKYSSGSNKPKYCLSLSTFLGFALLIRGFCTVSLNFEY